VSKRNPILKDIQIGNYRATWNLNEHGQAWIIHPESVSEVGCIHTCQGLEVDYIGVIVGPDLIVRNGEVKTIPKERASSDKSVHGWKTLMKTNPEAAKKRLDSIIKNTYRTLMTRGMKGCYIYFTDKETEEYFKGRMDAPEKKEKVHSLTKSPYMGEMINIPLFDSVGCGDLMFADSTVQELLPVKANLMSRGSKYFVLRTSGDSMNRAGINDGDLVLCRKDYHPEEGNRVVALIGDDATIKEFHREEDSVILKPRSSNPRHQPLIFTDNDEIKIQGVVVSVLERGET
jgi:SOS-response transcriptional repressor LexA